jgi:hypothetical protein
MSVDASAIVAILTREPEADALGPIRDGAFSDHLADYDIRGGFGDLSQTPREASMRRSRTSANFWR